MLAAVACCPLPSFAHSGACTPAACSCLLPLAASLQYRNEELHRLLEAAPGSAYTIMTTVLTTAMHGEKFRWVLPRALLHATR